MLDLGLNMSKSGGNSKNSVMLKKGSALMDSDVYFRRLKGQIDRLQTLHDVLQKNRQPLKYTVEDILEVRFTFSHKCLDR